MCEMGLLGSGGARGRSLRQQPASAVESAIGGPSGPAPLGRRRPGRRRLLGRPRPPISLASEALLPSSPAAVGQPHQWPRRLTPHPPGPDRRSRGTRQTCDPRTRALSPASTHTEHTTSMCPAADPTNRQPHTPPKLRAAPPPCGRGGRRCAAGLAARVPVGAAAGLPTERWPTMYSAPSGASATKLEACEEKAVAIDLGGGARPVN